MVIRPPLPTNAAQVRECLDVLPGSGGDEFCKGGYLAAPFCGAFRLELEPRSAGTSAAGVTNEANAFVLGLPSLDVFADVLTNVFGHCLDRGLDRE